MRQVLQIVTGRDTELADKVACRALQVAVVAVVERAAGTILLGPAKVGIAGDGGGALEALQAGLGFRLCTRVEGGAAEELVGGNALLVAEFAACILFIVAA